MESVEFLPKILKFYGVTDLDNIFKRDGILESLPGSPMEFSKEDGVLNFTVAHGNRPSLVIDQNIINISQVSELKITDRRGREVFSTNTPTLGLPKSLKSLDVRIVKANKGSEGTHMKGKQVVLAADQDIFLKDIFECRTCGLVGSLCCCTECARVCHKGHDCKLKRTSPKAYCDCWEKCKCNALLMGNEKARNNLLAELVAETDLVSISNSRREKILLFLVQTSGRRLFEQKQNRTTRIRWAHP